MWFIKTPLDFENYFDLVVIKHDCKEKERKYSNKGILHLYFIPSHK
jgi:hypothetical protein